MASAGYAAATSASNLKSKITRHKDVKPGNRASKPIIKALPINQPTKPIHQAQLHQIYKDEGITNIPEPETCQDLCTTEYGNNLPTSLETSCDNQAINTDPVEGHSSDSEGDFSLLSLATNNEHEPREDTPFSATHEDIFLPQGEWDEDTIFDIPASDVQHDGVEKVVQPDFTLSTSTLVAGGDYVTNSDKSSTFQDDTGNLKPLDLSLVLFNPIKLGEGDLVGQNGKSIQALLDKLNAAEEEIATLSAEKEKSLRSLREETDIIIAKSERDIQERDALIAQQTTETAALQQQIHKQTQDADAKEMLYQEKCVAYNELFHVSEKEDPVLMSERDFARDELVRICVQHEKEVKAAEARIQIERETHAENFKEQEEIIRSQDDLVVSLETDLEESRKSLQEQEASVKLKEEALRQKDDDILALQDSIQDLVRQKDSVRKAADGRITYLEGELKTACNKIQACKTEAEQANNNAEIAAEQFREQLEDAHELIHLHESQAANEAEEKTKIGKEMEKLRFEFEKARDTVRGYEILGPVRSPKPEDLRPKKRLSQEVILASSDPTLLTAALEKAWSKIQDYELLGISNTKIPIEERELDIILREYEVAKREKDVILKEKEVERVAGAANAELIVQKEKLIEEVAVFKEKLGGREADIRNLARQVRGLEDDLTYQKTGRHVGEVDDENEVDVEDEVVKPTSRLVFNADGKYLGLKIFDAEGKYLGLKMFDAGGKYLGLNTAGMGVDDVEFLKNNGVAVEFQYGKFDGVEDEVKDTVEDQVRDEDEVKMVKEEVGKVVEGDEE